MKSHKRLILIAMALVFALGAIPIFAIYANNSSNHITVTIDGHPVYFHGQQPVIVHNRVMVPVRGVYERLGFAVSWFPETRTATLVASNVAVVIPAGRDYFTVNGLMVFPEIPQMIVNNNMMMPLATVAESIGGTAGWDPVRNIAVITTPGVEPPYIPYEPPYQPPPYYPPVPTPYPTPEPMTPWPWPPHTPEQPPTQTPMPWPTPYNPVPTPAPTPAPPPYTPAPTPYYTPAPTPYNTPAPYQTPVPTPEPTPPQYTPYEPTPYPTPVPTPQPTPTPVPTPVPTPPPTPTPVPTATPAPTPSRFIIPRRRLTDDELRQWIREYHEHGGINELEYEIVRLVNIEREREGLNPVVVSPTLMMAARFKSQSMADIGYFAHESPVYGHFANISRQLFNFPITALGENLGRFQRTAAIVVNAWMNSPGHRGNIMNPRWTEIGVGAIDYHWTQKFADSNTAHIPAPTGQ